MSKIIVGATPVKVLSSNVRRMNLSVNNQSVGGQVIYLDNSTPDGLSVDNASYVLNAGQSLNFVLLFDGKDIKLPWSAIASGAGAILYYKDMAEDGGG